MQKLSLRLLTTLALTLATIVAPSLHANINNIKGTYDILKPEYKHFSAIHGAVAWETGTIRRMYDLGALGKKGSHIKSKTIALVRQIFYRIPESTGITDFVIANKIGNLPDEDIALFVADSLLYIKNLPDLDSYKKYQELFESYKSADEKKKSSLKRKLNKSREQIGEESKNDPLFASYNPVLKNVLPFITNAALECSIEDYLPPYTPNLILLSLLYKKDNCNRDMLETYYNRLQSTIDCLHTPTDWSGWKEDVFQETDFDLFLTELQETKPGTLLNNASYEKYVFVSLSPTDYPPIISYATACMGITSDGKKTNCFPDCMDSTIRNLINLLSYSPETKLFDSALLETRLGFPVPQFLKDFYQKNPNPVLASSTDAHNDWAQMVISNIPFVTYNNRIPKDSSPKERGFIKIESSSAELKEFLTKKSFSLVKKSTTVYEIKSSVQNLIIALNHILGLNLFDSDLAQEFMKDDFIQTYLPKMAAKLKATVPHSFDIQNSDKNDYTSQKITLPLNFAFEQPEPYTVSVITKTRAGHGEILLKLDEETQSMQLKLTFSENPISKLLLTSYLNFCSCKNEAIINPQDFFTQTSTYLLYLFSQPIDDPDRGFDVLNITPLMDENIYKLFLFVAQKNDDIKIKTDMTFGTYQAALRTGFAEKNKSTLEEIINAAKEGGDSPDKNTQENALNLFSDLVSRDKGLDEAFDAAKTGLKSTDKDMQENTIDLFLSLISKDRALDEALDAAKIGLKATCLCSQETAFNIFSELVSKDRALDEALEAAKIGIESTDNFIQEKALNIFSDLVAKDKALDKASIEAIKKQSKAESLSVREEAQRVLKAIEDKRPIRKAIKKLKEQDPEVLIKLKET